MPEYILNSRQYKRLRTKGFAMSCAKCDEKLEIGDKVHRQANGQKIFHKVCYGKMFLGSDEPSEVEVLASIIDKRGDKHGT